MALKLRPLDPESKTTTGCSNRSFSFYHLLQKFYSKVHAKKVKFAMEIQISPHCDDHSKETAIQDEFYLGTDSELKSILKRIVLLNHKIFVR